MKKIENFTFEDISRTFFFQRRGFFATFQTIFMPQLAQRKNLLISIKTRLKTRLISISFPLVSWYTKREAARTEETHNFHIQPADSNLQFITPTN